jgi:hypothetical protein
MDDLLSQIFGVLRDERAELQSSIPPGRGGARVPAEVKPDADSTGPVRLPGARDASAPSGIPGAPDTNDGAVPRVRQPDDGLVHRGDDRSGPVLQPDSSPVGGLGILDPPPRTVYVADEVTPPATDIADLQRGGRDADHRDKPS